ncbi:MAG: TIGR04086 family membrane protein [Lachnospiraceae bacterium]|nr:TIGR04086 family membrane protein [Lachnospiraceae bacterium]
MMNSNVALHPWGFLKTLLISYVLTALLLGGLAFLMYRAKLGATEAAWGVMVIYLVACAVGGFLTGRRVGTQRLLWGLLSGVLYFVVLAIVSLLLGEGFQGEGRQIMTVLAACLAGSAVGAFLS